jgi:hypothetical protein
MNKVTNKVLTGVLTVLAFIFVSINVNAASLESVFPTDKPSVSVESGYKSSFDVYGVELSPASTYGRVELITPFKHVDLKLSALTAGSKFNAFEADLLKTVEVSKQLAFTVDVGTDYYSVASANRNTVGVGLAFDKLSVLSYIAVPYVRYNYDVDNFNFGTTALPQLSDGGLTFGAYRQFSHTLNTWSTVSLTPYVETTHFDGYHSFKAGGKLSVTLYNKLSPFVGVDWIDNNIDAKQFTYNGSAKYYAGLSFKF